MRLKAFVVSGLLAVLVLGTVTPAASAQSSTWDAQCRPTADRMAWNVEMHGRHARVVDMRGRQVDVASVGDRARLRRSHTVHRQLRDRYAAWARHDAGRFNAGCGGIDIDAALAAARANRPYVWGGVHITPVTAPRLTTR